jgi:polysaccharide biosynthesis transport protein
MTGASDPMNEEGGGLPLLSHLPAIARQRKWWLIIPAVLLSLAGLAAALLLPTRYQSVAVLLVESPQLPEAIAGAPSADVVDRRIAKIRQQVLSRPDLIEIIQKLDLYTKKRSSTPLSTIIEEMRKAVTIAPVGAEIQENSGGRSSTIAFSMTFEYSEASKAQGVAQELVDRVLKIDSIKNAEQAANTVQFLTDQATDLQTQIALLETQISGIKARNGSTLSGANTMMMGSNTGSIDAQIAALQRDNAQLNNQRDLTKTAAVRDPLVANAEAQLAAARAVYVDTHPDVQIARQRLAEAKELASRNVANLPVDTIASQVAFNNSQIAALQAARNRESSQSAAVLSAQAKAPAVMEQVAQLQQRLEGLNSQYQLVSSRMMTAKAGQKMDDEQKGERLSLVDPPIVPDEPSWPNRPKFILGGLLAGLGLGFLLMLGIELIQRPIRGLEGVKSATGTAPLVALPSLSVQRKKQKFFDRFRSLWKRQAKSQA